MLWPKFDIWTRRALQSVLRVMRSAYLVPPVLKSRKGILTYWPPPRSNVSHNQTSQWRCLLSPHLPPNRPFSATRGIPNFKHFYRPPRSMAMRVIRHNTQDVLFNPPQESTMRYLCYRPTRTGCGDHQSKQKRPLPPRNSHSIPSPLRQDTCPRRTGSFKDHQKLETLWQGQSCVSPNMANTPPRKTRDDS